MISKSTKQCKNVVWRGEVATEGERMLAAEIPVAFVFDGGTEAVMMATPRDLEDFALGFALNDGIASTADDIVEIGVVEVNCGIELRIKLANANKDALIARRRHRAGPVGCGLCGVESIGAALPSLPAVQATLNVSAPDIVAAMATLSHAQTLNRETHAVHAAAFFVPGKGIVCVREDVGRHNALDKLAGALIRARYHPSVGVVLMTSRISVELVQKVATMGVPILAAISAPTSLAVSEATNAGVTIVGIVRNDGLEIFTHPERIVGHAR